MCHPVTDALRSHLDLPQDQGLLVMDVVPEGPAAKAGIQRHDILLTADEQPLSDVKALSRCVDRRGDAQMAIQMLRGGKPHEVRVTPTARPPLQQRGILVPDPDRHALRDWIERLDPNIQRLDPDAEQGPIRQRRLRLRFLHPGLVLEGHAADSEWPADLSVAITREGNEPLKIKVRRGDQTWEINRDQLAELPNKIRPLVAELLGSTGSAPRPPEGFEMDLPEIDLPDVQLPAPGQPIPPIELPPALEPPPPGAAPGDVRQRLNDIQDQLEQLRRELKNLRQPTAKSNDG
jgi:hypothetical protein